MSKFLCFCKDGNMRWKLIIMSIALLMFILVFMPVVVSVDSEYKFPVSIKTNELDPDDINIIPIEASSHEEYGQKAYEKNKEIFDFLIDTSDLYYKDFEDYCEANIDAWGPDENFDDFIAEFEGIGYALGLDKFEDKLERVLFMGRLLAEPDINMKK